MLLAGVIGHGPTVNGKPLYPGIAHGVDVAWLALDYPQARAIWKEEIRPRFAGVAILRENPEWSCQLPGHGTLYVRSSENMDSIRGLGAKLGGVLLDECCKYDLEYAWTSVIRAPLADNEGWAIFGSTTYAGWDGNQLKETPSYFNRLCLAHEAGQLDSEWNQFHATTRQGYHVTPAEVEKLYRDMGRAAAEELDALLLQGGPGLWASEWRQDQHVLDRLPELPAWWQWFAGYDWGYDPSTGWFGIAAVGDERFIVATERTHQREHAELAGYECGKFGCRYPLQAVGADGSMWAQTHSRSGVGPTIGEEWVAGFTRGWAEGSAKRQNGKRYPCPVVVPVAHGPQARATRSQLLHRYLAWDEQHPPRLRFVGPSCPYAVRTIPTLPVDPLKPNQPDTDAEDHAWDGVGYLLQVRPFAEQPAGARHPEGLDRLSIKATDDFDKVVQHYTKPKPIVEPL